MKNGARLGLRAPSASLLPGHTRSGARGGASGQSHLSPLGAQDHPLGLAEQRAYSSFRVPRRAGQALPRPPTAQGLECPLRPVHQSLPSERANEGKTGRGNGEPAARDAGRGP